MINSAVLNLTISPCVMYLLAKMVLSGSIIQTGVALMLLVGTFMTLKKFLSLAKIDPQKKRK